MSKNETKQHDRVEAAAKALGRAVMWAARWHPWIAAILVTVPVAVLLRGPHIVVVASMVTAAVAAAWSHGHRASFDRVFAARARASWRREIVYRRRWRSAMFLSGLACRFDGDDVIPQLGRVRSTWAADVVAVRLTAAQERLDWEARSSALAETFGALECRARAVRPHWIELEFVFRRDLPVVPALPVPARPNLDRLPIGRRGDGRLWQIRLTATHVLIGGATGSGKGSVIWSIIRALLSGVRDGWVQIWACDPKGGMELGHGTIDADGEPTCPLFACFARTSEAIADLLGTAVELMAARARSLSGISRQHQPTVDQPTIVILIDELATIAAYGSETVRDRVRQHLGILLSQGRALGVHLVTAVQDPGQVRVELRRAFPTRIALRTVDADQVDMILGKEAWVRGARCELIAETAPGCGWVLLDGEREPTWVRASWVGDQDIGRMTATYAPTPPASNESDVGGRPPATAVQADSDSAEVDELEGVA